MSIQLKRIKFEFEPLIKEMLDKIVDTIWASSDSIFLDPEIGGGQIVAAIEQKLRSYGHSDENIAKRVYGISSNKYIIDVAVRRHALVGTYVVGDFLEGTLNDMKFDVVVGNPPYDGGSNTHQRFFNLGVELLYDGGWLCFIQPAIPYFIEGTAPNIAMREYITFYVTDVELKDPNVFKNAGIGTDLAVTLLHKIIGNGNIRTVTYSNGISFENVDIIDMTMTGIDLNIGRSIKRKLEEYGKIHGTLFDRFYSGKVRPDVFYIQKVRGGTGRRDQHTFISADPAYHHTGAEHGIILLPNESIDSLVSYLKTYIARYALSLNKTSFNLRRVQVANVPLVKFDQEWSDDKLQELLSITDEEYAEIRRVIPEYYE